MWQVPGNFHVSTHSAETQPDNPDMTHIIHKVRFGMDLQEGKVMIIDYCIMYMVFFKPRTIHIFANYRYLRGKACICNS